MYWCKYLLWHHRFSHREYLLDNLGVSTGTIVVRLLEIDYYVSNIYPFFVLLLFWFQCFDSKSKNVLQYSNSLNNKRNFGTPTPGSYCNASNQYLTMAVNSSQPTVYCVIIIYYYYFWSQLQRLRLCMKEEGEDEDELNWYEDEVGVGIVATPRSYESCLSQLRRQRCVRRRRRIRRAKAIKTRTRSG